MILSCPECGTQYTLKESQLGPRGRTVRCAACKHTWHAEIPIDLRYSEPKNYKEEPVEDLQSVKAKKLPGKYRAMLEDKKRMQAMAVEIGMWGGMAALVLLVLALGYFLRVDVVKAFPRLAGAYASVGLDVKGTNLRFVSQTAGPVLKAGRFVVTIKAQVTNIGDQAEPVPPVRVDTQDASLQPFLTTLIPSGGLVVEPHATRTLTFDIADPTNRVARIDLTFDLEAMKKAQKGQKLKGSAHLADAGSEEAAMAIATNAPAVAEARPLATLPAPAGETPVVDAAAPSNSGQGLDEDIGPDANPNSGKPVPAEPNKGPLPLRGALSYSDDAGKPAKPAKPSRESKS